MHWDNRPTKPKQMTKEQLLQVFQDFSEQTGETYEQRSIHDSEFGDLADALLKQPTTALDLIAAERDKWISKGYTVENDVKMYPNGELVDAAFNLAHGYPLIPRGWDAEYWIGLRELPKIDRLRIAATWFARELERVIYVERKKEGTCK